MTVTKRPIIKSMSVTHEAIYRSFRLVDILSVQLCTARLPVFASCRATLCAMI
jgi:hypothetical protein